jgi:CubicO group peptidase (beta-lactamase class C family)
MVDADTRFAIGSTTKAMTVMALGMLVDEGKVRWDAPSSNTCRASSWPTRMSRANSLCVTSSRTARVLGNADLLWAGGDYSADEIFKRVGTLPLSYSFRGGWVYQNIMYALAGEVVQKVSGMTWDKFLETRIFQPLGMKATVTRLAGINGQPNVASPHGALKRHVARHQESACRSRCARWFHLVERERHVALDALHPRQRARERQAAS